MFLYNFLNAIFVDILLNGQSAANFNMESSLSIENSLFIKCIGNGESGAISYKTTKNFNITVKFCSILFCSGIDGFALRSTGNAVFNSSIIDKNYMSSDSLERQGSSITISCHSKIDLSSNNITNNYSHHRSGFYLVNGLQNICDLIAYNNTSITQGAILQFQSGDETTTLSSSIIYGNKCIGIFSTIRCIEKILNIQNSLIYENEAPSSFYSESSTINVFSSYIQDASKDANGELKFEQTFTTITSIPIITPIGYNNNNYIKIKTCIITKSLIANSSIFQMLYCTNS